MTFGKPVVVLTLILVTCYANQGCISDLDLTENASDMKSYDFPIPMTDVDGYWVKSQKIKNYMYEVTANRNFYLFGEFGAPIDDEPTTINAGLYHEGEDGTRQLIYETVIDCDAGNWKNRILNKDNEIEVILRGELSCNHTIPGNKFDLILKNDNFKLANWIFNAKALQYGVTEINKYKWKSENPVRPTTRVNSKYSTFTATHFQVETTGRANMERLVFGQCEAWPKGLDCASAWKYLFARSKVNTTNALSEAAAFGIEVPQPYWLKRMGPTFNGLGVFGNNVHTPYEYLCEGGNESRYFAFYMPLVHADTHINVYRVLQRAYCCCVDMVTGELWRNDRTQACFLANDESCTANNCMSKTFVPALYKASHPGHKADN